MRSWVVFDGTGFPIAFADSSIVPLWEIEQEFPGAEIRECSGDERSALLVLHQRGPSLFDESLPDKPEPAEPDHSLRDLVDRYGFDPVEAALGRIRKQMAGPIAQVGQRDGDQRTSKGHRSTDVRRFSTDSHSARLLHQFMAAVEGLTDAEATDRAVGAIDRPGMTLGRWEGCRRRCSDLREAGYIMDSGRERDGRIVWLVTNQGAGAVDNLIRTGWSR